MRGREHTTLGGVAVVAEGRTGIALSRGGARKVYPHTDPNEDAAAFAVGEGGILLAVTDGHSGHQASEVAIERLLTLAAPAWTRPEPLDGRWREEASRVLFEINTAILEAVARSGATATRTTLVAAVVRPRQNLLAYTSMGDSHLFHVGGTETVDLAFDSRRKGFFLGFPSETRESIGERCVARQEELAGTRALVLASDGLSERGIGVEHPEAAVAECVERAARADPDLRSLELVRAISQQAVEAQQRQRSGDNIATAAVWLDD